MHSYPHWNTDASGNFADSNPVFTCLELKTLFRTVSLYLSEVHKKKLVPRVLRVPLLPRSKQNWQTAMIAYFAKCICMGMRLIQEYQMVTKYLGEWQLREMLIGRQVPAPSTRNIVYDFDSVDTEGSHDLEIGNNRVWDLDLFQYE